MIKKTDRFFTEEEVRVLAPRELKRARPMTDHPGTPPQPYLEKWDAQIVALQNEIRLLKEAETLALDMLKTIKRLGELACVNVEPHWSYSMGGKKPASKDVWQFPRYLLQEIDAIIAASEAPSVPNSVNGEKL